MLTPAATCALVVPSESEAGMDGMRSVVLVLVDVEVAGPTRDSFLDLSLMIDGKEKVSTIT